MATKVSLTRRGSEAAAGLRPGSAIYPSEGSYLGPAPSTVRRAARGSTLALLRRLEAAAVTLEAGALPTYRFYV